MLNFWQNKKVLVTGHTGFKGSWLSLWLQLLGAEVIGFSLNPPTTPNLFALANVEDGMTSIIGDIRDFSLIKNVINEYQPEIVIHMAAQALVRHSYIDPIETYSTNVMGSVHLFEAIRQNDCVKAVVNVTTDKCYENKEWLWGYRENDTLGGHDPYSNSKACSELVTAAYRDSFFKINNIGLASARAGNVIGGGDWAADRLIPDIINACIKDDDVIIRNPNALRPWQHVLEPLNAYLLLAQRLYESPLDFAEGWNFGPSEADAKPVSWIADTIVKFWNNGKTNLVLNKNPQPHEATNLKLDCSKAKSLLAWQPRWNLEAGLAQTVSWYKAYQASENMRDVTIAQIKNFISNPTKSQNKCKESIPQ